MKRCTVCCEEKPLAGFFKRARSPDGLQPLCKVCDRARARAYYQAHKARLIADQTAYIKANPQVKRKARANYYAKNGESERARLAEYRRANPEKRAALGRAWRKENPALVKAYGARYRALKLRRTCLHDPELLDLVELEAFDLTVLREMTTGVRWEVDHTVPLQGKTVSGLHNERNLAVITRAANRSKSNRYWPDMP